jgi:hypothetical protein
MVYTIKGICGRCLTNRLVIPNQRGGVSKTTTTLTLGHYFASKRLKVGTFDKTCYMALAAELAAMRN